MVRVFVYPIAVLTISLACANGGPLNRGVRSLPDNWRSLLTDDVYHYHLNQQRGANHMFESDIAGVDRDTSYQDLCNSPTVKLTSNAVCPGSAFGGNDRVAKLRNAIVDKSMRWKDGIIPFEISQSFTPNEMDIIRQALEDLMRKTCLRFEPYTQLPSQADYISFVRRGLGCSSYVARTGGKQLIDLQPGCIYQIGEVQHEVMHALGFYHEQSRTDRDQYVDIIWDNVIVGAEDQFKTYRSDAQGMPYDYESIMHYGWNYFAKDNTKPTILPKVKSALGSRVVVSRYDVEKINRLYECPPRGNNAATTPARVTNRPLTNRPLTNRPVTNRPVTNRPVTNRPVVPVVTTARTTPRTYPPTTVRTTPRTVPRTTTRSPTTTTTTTTTTVHSIWGDFKSRVKDFIRTHSTDSR